MASSAPTPPTAQMLYCRNCKNEFISYKVAGAAECPRCGSPVTPAASRHRHSRLIALAVIAAVVVAAILAYAILR